MSKRLYIDDDAPAEIKENVRLSQLCLDNMLTFQGKAANGTLTLDDLESMVRKNHTLIDRFPPGNPVQAGLPQQVDGTAGLLALAATRKAELAGSSKPVYTVNTIKELNTLCQKSPEEIGDLFMAAAQQQKEEEAVAELAVASTEKEGPTLAKPKALPVSGLNRNLFRKHLDRTAELLDGCKHLYYDLPVNWPEIEPLEQQLPVHIDGMAEHGTPAAEFLESYLTDQADDEECEEKKPAAAFLLASLPAENHRHVDRLFELLQENDDLAPMILRALKYSLNQKLNNRLAQHPELEAAAVQTAAIETLQYRGAYKPDSVDRLRQSSLPVVQVSVLKADALENQPLDASLVESLVEGKEKEVWEPLIFTLLLTHRKEAVWTCRKQIQLAAEVIVDLPLILSYAGDERDLPLLAQALDHKESQTSAIRALGMLGLTRCVYTLLDLMKEADWRVQKTIVESLELITGACLPLPPPDIIEGPEGKEYEVEVVTEWHRIWSDWWCKNGKAFQEHTRYRRGNRFHLGGCIEEMAYPLGNHWSRQGSYYEVRIRSGDFVTHFEADWYVKDQQVAIQAWLEWWKSKGHHYGNSQWLFNGKESSEV